MTRPIHIALMMRGGNSWIGGIEYVKSIVLALASLPDEVRSTFRLSLVCSQKIDPSFYHHILPYLSNVYYEESEQGKPTLLNFLLWRIKVKLLKHTDSYHLDSFLRKVDFDFVYPYFNPHRKKFRSAAWIYDFQHKYLGDFFSKAEIEGRDRSFALVARYAPTIILSSETAKSDFDKFYPEAASKSRVLSFKIYPDPTWYEADPRKTQQAYSLPDRFFLVSNQFWQHKNHLVVFEALKQLKERSIKPLVVCTGHLYDYRKPDYSDRILQTIQRFGLSQQVFLLGTLPRIDQIQLVRRSLAVIQPSLFEGWSTVVEEAKCMAKPIIISDIPVHIEQNPPRRFFFDRHSPESLASQIENCWENLSPGPNLKEEETRVEYLKEVRAFGFSFLKLARGE
jgi:glycosyltransferase involved in cell wall biosynthesis